LGEDGGLSVRKKKERKAPDRCKDSPEKKNEERKKGGFP